MTVLQRVTVARSAVTDAKSAWVKAVAGTVTAPVPNAKWPFAQRAARWFASLRLVQVRQRRVTVIKSSSYRYFFVTAHTFL